MLGNATWKQQRINWKQIRGENHILVPRTSLSLLRAVKSTHAVCLNCTSVRQWVTSTWARFSVHGPGSGFTSGPQTTRVVPQRLCRGTGSSRSDSYTECGAEIELCLQPRYRKARVQDMTLEKGGTSYCVRRTQALDLSRQVQNEEPLPHEQLFSLSFKL